MIAFCSAAHGTSELRAGRKLYGKSVVTWGRTLEVLAKEWPEETFATLDAAKRYLQRRVYVRRPLLRSVIQFNQ